MKLKYILSAVALTLGLASCSNEVEQVNGNGGEKAPLQITANIEGTRAAGVEDIVFYESESIGITVEKIDKVNIRGQYDGDKWNISPNISLPYGEYFVSAYYPYDEKNAKNEIYVTAGTNHLVANTWVYTDGKEPAVANLTFKHIMSRVRIEVSGAVDNLLENVEISGNQIYQNALCIQNNYDYYFKLGDRGVITVQNKSIEALEIQSIDALLIPTEVVADETHFTLNFADGKKYTTTVSLPVLKQSGFYSVQIKLSDKDDTLEPPLEWHDYVDLGLPSGLMWATCNVGAHSPEEYGNYFAWGEVEPKSMYSNSNYKWGTTSSINKYGTDTDNRNVLVPEDDAAHMNWGGNWRMPTDIEFSELYLKCSWIWESRNNVNGYRVVGPNGNWIFLPAAGHYETSISSAGTRGYYWSSKLSSTNYKSQFLYFYNTSQSVREEYYRYSGCSVRPVFSK